MYKKESRSQDGVFSVFAVYEHGQAEVSQALRHHIGQSQGIFGTRLLVQTSLRLVSIFLCLGTSAARETFGMIESCNSLNFLINFQFLATKIAFLSA